MTVELRNFLLAHYSRAEILTLCSDYFRDFYQDYDGVPITNSELARKLVEHCAKRGQIENLRVALQRTRTEFFIEEIGPLVEPAALDFPPDRQQVFISYANANRGFAQRLAKDIREAGLGVWIAPESIQPGELWVAAIDRGLSASDKFVIVLSEHALKSRYLKYETSYALSAHAEGRGRVLPVLLSDCDVSQLSPLLTTLQRIDFTKSYSDGVAELRRALATPTGTEGSPSEPSPSAMAANSRPAVKSIVGEAQPFHRKISRRALLIGGGVTVAGGAALVARLVTTANPPISLAHTLVSRASRSLTFELTLGVSVSFRNVPAGEFLLGSDPSKDPDTLQNETPQRRISLSDYWISDTLITNSQYSIYAGEKQVAHGFPIEDAFKPVVNISWTDAVAYASWLRAKIGRPVALPTEPQWEKAARGPNGLIYPWGNTFVASRANTLEGAASGPTPVKQYSPDGDSVYGIAGMCGNVWQWTNDVYAEDAYSALADGTVDPSGPAEGPERVIRGGSWNMISEMARSAFRAAQNPAHRNALTGFRVAFVES